mgnify:CR=1 FL=1|tara:strand:- start:313 stop:1194 length:882 start_codon:yes stop_codon:yes gene_type:complete
MIKFKILIPVYNDWESLVKLLEKIDFEISNIKAKFSILVVDDASTADMPSSFSNYKNIDAINILKMKNNQGPNRANASGIMYLSKNPDFDYLILMDGDGEDRPEELKTLTELALKGESISVVAKRVKRSEPSLFQVLYRLHKLLTLIFTGKHMNFGHYSCLTKKDLIMISSKKDLWCNFSGTVKKYVKALNSINSIRGFRYAGQSKVPIFNLIIHSFSIIAVFKYQVLFRSILFFLIMFLPLQELPFLTVFSQLLLVIFTSIIFIVSRKSNMEELTNSVNNIKERTNIHARRL